MHYVQLLQRIAKQTHNLWQNYGRSAQNNVPLHHDIVYIYPTGNGASIPQTELKRTRSAKWATVHT
jgi:hypothetical protein